jgi:oligopeptide/dipeptide ABC transporter ATP-binding protein
MLRIRGREIAMIFQEPMTSLNPVFTVGDQITEAILLHQDVSHKQAQQTAIDAMNDVGISDPARRLRSYPHQFSGGMRQRVMIAMALACRPKLLLADEPTSALDVTIQAQILALLHNLQRQRNLGILFITHDLGLVAQHADVVCVMYAGRVVEYASVFELFERPLHPYTRALLRCRPSLRERRRRLETVAQIVSDPAEFKPLRDDRNRELIPWWTSDASGCELVEVTSDHWIGCRAGGAVSESGSARRPNLDFRRDR